MSRPDHRAKAERLAGQSLDGDYGSEEYRLRLATVAQVHATLALADRVGVLLGVIEAHAQVLTLADRGAES